MLRNNYLYTFRTQNKAERKEETYNKETPGKRRYAPENPHPKARFVSARSKAIILALRYL
jgi:hypothetical protein